MCQAFVMVRAAARRSTEGKVSGKVNELDDVLSLVLDRMRAMFLARLREVDLTPPSAITLKLLSHEPMPLGAVAEHFNIDPSAVTWIADRLESRGLATRASSPTDRRVKLLTITDDGRALVNTLHACSTAFPGFATLSAAERKQLTALLRRAFA